MKKNVVIVINGIPEESEVKIIDELVKGISALYITDPDTVKVKVTKEDEFVDAVFNTRRIRFEQEPSEEIKSALDYVQAVIGDPQYEDFRRKLADAIKQVITGRTQDEGKLVKALEIIVNAQDRSVDAKYIKSRHFSKHMYHFVALLRSYEIIRGGL